MLIILLAILVVCGFIFWLVATWPVAHAERIARGFFLGAAVVWAWIALTGAGGR